MAVQVRVPPLLRRYTEGKKIVEAQGIDVSAILDDLETRFPGFKNDMFTGDGSLHRFLNIYVNDEDIRFLDSLRTRLSDGDVVAILPAVAGGCSYPPG